MRPSDNPVRLSVRPGMAVRRRKAFGQLVDPSSLFFFKSVSFLWADELSVRHVSLAGGLYFMYEYRAWKVKLGV